MAKDFQLPTKTLGFENYKGEFTRYSVCMGAMNWLKENEGIVHAGLSSCFDMEQQRGIYERLEKSVIRRNYLFQGQMISEMAIRLNRRFLYKQQRFGKAVALSQDKTNIEVESREKERFFISC